MDKAAENSRLHDYLTVLQRYFQGGGTTSEDRHEEGWRQGASGHTRQRGHVRFTSAADDDSFMLARVCYQHHEIVAKDRAYINYGKFEGLTERNVVYVTRMKKSLNYEVLVDCMDMSAEGKMGKE